MKIITKILSFPSRYLNPIKYAKRIGVNIGNNCKIVKTPLWGSEPWLVYIGNGTEISFGCTFITHDGGTWVLRGDERYKNVIKYGKIVIGNYCFIGANSVLLPNVRVGDQSIIAAGSVVTKDIPSAEVWGGNPAHYIMTVEEYARRCLEQNPQYNVINYRRNKKEEVLRVLGREYK